MAIRTCIAVINEKGGTAKSTTSVNLAAALGEIGQRVLLVDLDGQAASSRWVGVEEDNRLADAMTRGTKLTPIPNVLPNVSLIPASGRLDSIAHDLRPTQGGQMRKLLNDLAVDYDFILIDCPPSLGNRLIANGMLAATHVIVPVETSILALDGLKILLTTLEDIREGFGHNLVLAGVLACRYDYRTRLSRLVLDELRRALPGKVFKTVIRENVRMRECPASGQSILTFAPESTAAADYRALAAELLAPPQSWRQSAVLTTGQNSVENLRSNTSDKLLEGQRKNPPSALEVGEDELDPNLELEQPGLESAPDMGFEPQPKRPAPAPAPVGVESHEHVPVAEDPMAMLHRPAMTMETLAQNAAAADESAAKASTDSPDSPKTSDAPTVPATDGPPAEPEAKTTDALAKWLDQLASAEDRIKQQSVTPDEQTPATEPKADDKTDDADRVRIPAQAPPESASHHTPTAPIPEAKTASGADTTIPNMVSEPPQAFRTQAATTEASSTLDSGNEQAVVVPENVPAKPTFTPGVNGQSAPASEFSMMEILAGVKAQQKASAPSTAGSGSALPGLSDMPSLDAPTPPSATPGKPAPANAPAPKADKPQDPAAAKPGGTTGAPASAANEKAKPGQITPGPAENGDNFPALRAYLKQMQKDGKLPAKPTPQTTKEHKGGGLRTFFRKVVGSKRS